MLGLLGDKFTYNANMRQSSLSSDVLELMAFTKELFFNLHFQNPKIFFKICISKRFDKGIMDRNRASVQSTGS
jgi:hypothetical protein